MTPADTIIKMCDELELLQSQEAEATDYIEMLLTAAPDLIKTARREAKLREALKLFVDACDEGIAIAPAYDNAIEILKDSGQ